MAILFNLYLSIENLLNSILKLPKNAQIIAKSEINHKNCQTFLKIGLRGKMLSNLVTVDTG